MSAADNDSSSCSNGSSCSSEDDEDASMPELAGEVSVEELGLWAVDAAADDADDEGGAAGVGSSRSAAKSAEPRRLTMEQRRRLNLYSRPPPSGLLPPAAAASAASAAGSGFDAAAATAVVLSSPAAGEAAWATHDTPTIHEEDSGLGAAAACAAVVDADAASSIDAADIDAEPAPTSSNGGRQSYYRRARTLSEPMSPDVDSSVAADCGGGGDVGGGGGGGGGGRRRTRTQSTSVMGLSAGSRWPRALSLAFQTLRTDSWRDHPVASMPEEEALRHQFNPHRRQWVQDRVRVKLEPRPFDRGAMRQCYRLKKLARFSRLDNWSGPACNYVAKRYIEEVDNSVYFEDVRLQMNAKLWAQEYNRHLPPKKVDMMQMSVIELVGRPGNPLYHLEQYIEGEYVKYNSNSGFVDEKLRQTPQALSHFTFERSGHQLIVVDIQGVDDLYTDPQIHTASGVEYGDGNLGVRGMALFFRSHACNDICRKMGLSAFDLAPSEAAAAAAAAAATSAVGSTGSETRVRADTFAVGSPPDSPASVLFDSGCSSTDEESGGGGGNGGVGGGGGNVELQQQQQAPNWSASTAAPLRRRRNESGELTPEEELLALSVALNRRQRPSCVQGVLAAAAAAASGRRHRRRRRSRSRSDDSGSSDCSLGGGSGSGCGGPCCLPGLPEVPAAGPVLGRIHHELARLHESGRFCPAAAATPGGGASDVDWPAALFHERLSAELGVVEAAANLARLNLRLPADCLQDVPPDVLQPDPSVGLAYLESAAKLGDRAAMLQLARAHDLGRPDAGADAEAPQRDWDRAAHYYQQALAMCGQADREGGYDCCLDTPSYALRARLAELYMTGGHGLDPDPAASVDLYAEAAEDATVQGNGKLAAKYYALAEEAAALVPEDSGP